MTIPALPDAPALGDSPEVFNTKAFAFVAALDDWGTAANAVAAAVDADATAADADAATATTQAGIATTKANEAAASALDANSAELGAQAAQTAAELAATNAAASYDAFDDRYLGAKSSDPSVDNDGGALIIGALYFNTTDQKMKVYATLGWKDAGSAVNGTARRQSFTATAGQTSFTVTDGYDANFADVYLNGVKLVNGVDVTVTSGTAVVLASGAAAGDSVDVIAYGAFEVANTYTQGEVDAFAVKLTGDQTIAGVKTFSGATTVMNGNVGIGTSSPSGKLEVQGGNVIVKTTDSNTTKLGFKRATLYNGDLVTGAIHTTAPTVGFSDGGGLAFATVAGNNAGTASLTDRMVIDDAGNMLVGNSTGSAPLLVTTNSLQITNANSGQLILRNSNSTAGYGWRLGPDSSGNNLVVFNQSGGGVYIVNGGTSWTGTSDERVKDIIEPISNAVEKLSTLRTVIGKYKTDEEGTRRSFLIAQDVQAVFPEAVHEKDDEQGTLGIAYTDMIPVLVKAIQEQQALITTLTERITALEAK